MRRCIEIGFVWGPCVSIAAPQCAFRLHPDISGRDEAGFGTSRHAADILGCDPSPTANPRDYMKTLARLSTRVAPVRASQCPSLAASLCAGPVAGHSRLLPQTTRRPGSPVCLAGITKAHLASNIDAVLRKNPAVWLFGAGSAGACSGTGATHGMAVKPRVSIIGADFGDYLRNATAHGTQNALSNPSDHDGV
jgi:hypothetical protein